MKIGLLGFNLAYNHRDMYNVNFNGNESLFEYDLIFIDLSHLFDGYSSYEEYQGVRKISKHDSVRLISDFKKRKSEILEFLKSGRNIVVFNGNEDICYYYTGKSKISGTGKNSKTTDYVDLLDSKKLLPIEYTPSDLNGSNLCFVNKRIEKLLSKYLNYLRYYTVYEITEGIVLMNINKTQRIISFYTRFDNGLLIFVPDLNFPGVNTKKESKIEKDYYSDIISFLNSLNECQESIPNYANKFLLPNEGELISNINKTIKDIELLNCKKIELENELAHIQNEKTFFVGTGKPLEKNVVNLFKEIGFDIVKYNPDSVEEDIVIKYKTNIAVVEVKGVSGSATEKHTSQVVKWKSEYHIENDILPKGILLVNAFNGKELDKRPKFFPDQMIKYATHQEICLMSTIQLYNIKEFLKSYPKQKDKIIKQILNTNGIFNSFSNWDEYIKKV